MSLIIWRNYFSYKATKKQINVVIVKLSFFVLVAEKTARFGIMSK